jgi:hypothetical protein
MHQFRNRINKKENKMMNFNLTKNDIAYLRLLLAIQLCENKKKNRRKTAYFDKNNILKYFIYADMDLSYQEK